GSSSEQPPPNRQRWWCSLCNCGTSKGSKLATHLTDQEHTLQLLTAGVGFARSDLLLTCGVQSGDSLRRWNKYIIGRTLLDKAAGAWCLQAGLLSEQQWMSMLNSVNNAVEQSGGWMKPLYIQLSNDDVFAASAAAAASLEPAPFLLVHSLHCSIKDLTRLVSDLGPEAKKPVFLGSTASCCALVPLERQPPRAATRLAFDAAVGAIKASNGFSGSAEPLLNFLWLEAGPPVRLGRNPGQRLDLDPPSLAAAAASAAAGPAGLSLGVFCDMTVPEEIEFDESSEAAINSTDSFYNDADDAADDPEIRNGQAPAAADGASGSGGPAEKRRRRDSRVTCGFSVVGSDSLPRVWRLTGFKLTARADDIELALRRRVSFQFDQVISYSDCSMSDRSFAGVPKSNLPKDPNCRAALLTESSGLPAEAAQSALLCAAQQPEVQLLCDRKLEISTSSRRDRPDWLPLGFGDGLSSRSQFLVLADFALALPCTQEVALKQLRSLLPLARSFHLPGETVGHSSRHLSNGRKLVNVLAIARFDRHEDCAKSLGLVTAEGISKSSSQQLLCRFAAMPQHATLGPLWLPVHNCVIWTRLGESSAGSVAGDTLTMDAAPFVCECHAGGRYCHAATSFRRCVDAASDMAQRLPRDASPEEARRIALQCLKPLLSSRSAPWERDLAAYR
ncbi:hypothetical protein BOX15_Mlig033722g1, partial [Macrostomum lignano]